MAGNVIAEFVAALRFEPRLEDLTEAEKKAKESAERIQAAYSKLGSGLRKVGAAALGGAAGLLAFVERSAASAAAIDDAARKAQVGAREYQRLSFAAMQAGSGPEALAGAFRVLNNQITEARKGTGPAADAFRTLGINATALVDLDVETRFGIIADALAKVDDDARRTALAMDLLGRGGTELLPMLADGSAGLKEMGDEAERLGIVLSDEALASAAAFDDQIAALKGQLGAAAREIGIELIPKVQSAIKHWDDWAKVVVGFGTALGGIKLAQTSSQLEGLIGKTASARLGMAGLTAAVFGLSFALAQAMDNALGLSDALAGVNQEKGGRGAVALGVLTPEEREQLAAAQGRLEEAQAQPETGSAFDDLRVASINKERAEIDRIQNNARKRGQLLADQLEREGRVTTGAKRAEGEVAIARAAEGTDRLTELAAEEAKRRAKKGGKKKEEIDTTSAEALFGDELRRLAERGGVGEVAVGAALKSAAESLKGGANVDVARQAALGQLGSLSGQDFSTKTRDPLLSSIFGNDVPDVELSKLAAGAEPQVLISTINNTFEISVDQQIDGAGDPADVADRVVQAFRGELQTAIEATTKTVKLNWVR